MYGLITDVGRMGEWSPECYRCEWVDGAATATPGARFRGYNRLGPLKWQRTAIVTTANPGREFSFTTINDRTERQETHWRYMMRQSEAGTLLTEAFQFLWCPTWNRTTELFIPRGRQVRRGIRETLQRIKTAAEST